MSYSHFFNDGENHAFYIEPRSILRPQKGFVLFYPRPTANTEWRGGKIYCSPGVGLFRGFDPYDRVYAYEEFSRMLEELTEAAEKVETGKV